MKDPINFFVKGALIGAVSVSLGLTLFACGDDNGGNDNGIGADVPVIEEPESSSDEVDDPNDEEDVTSSAAEVAKSSAATAKSSSSTGKSSSSSAKSSSSSEPTGVDKLPACTTGAMETVDSVNYVCDKEKWRIASAVEYKYGLCLNAKTGNAVKVNNEYYSCDGSVWNTIDSAMYSLGSCGSKNALEIETAGKATYLCATSKQWIPCDKEHNYAVVDEKACEDGKWRSLSAYEDYTGVVCNNAVADSIVWYEVGTIIKEFIGCDGENWYIADSISAAIGEVCSYKRKGSFSSDGKYHCDYDDVKAIPFWVESTDGEVATRMFCTKANYGEVKEGYGCDVSADGGYAWRKATRPEEFCEKICTPSVLNEVYGNRVCRLTDSGYVWDVVKRGESETGKVCTAKIASMDYKDWAFTDDGMYVCYEEDGEYSWHRMGSSEEATHKICGKTAVMGDLVRGDDGHLYTCRGGANDNGRYWVGASVGDSIRGQGCSKSIEGQFVWAYNSVRDSVLAYRCEYSSTYDYWYGSDQYTFSRVNIGGYYHRIIDIDGKTWLAENLKRAYDYKNADGRKGGVAPIISGVENADSVETYGRLYLWSAAMDSAGHISSSNKGIGSGNGVLKNVTGNVQGICPTGWHLPKKSEWNALFKKLNDGTSIEVDYMSAEKSYKWSGTTLGKGQDVYGIGIKPAGTVFYSTTKYSHFYMGTDANFWSSEEDTGKMAWSYFFKVSGVTEDTYDKNVYFSVRCVKD